MKDVGRQGGNYTKYTSKHFLNAGKRGPGAPHGPHNIHQSIAMH